MEVNYPTEQTCCGRIAYHEGDKETAKQLAEMFMGHFDKTDYIVGCSSSCTTYMKHCYSNLFHNSAFHNTYLPFINKIYDITEFIVNVLKIQSTGAVFPHKVAFIDDISTLNDGNIYSEPRTLLSNVEGLELIKLDNELLSCGYNEQFASTFEPISTELARRKVQNAIDKGAEYITSTDMGCLLHLQSYINKAKLPIKCKHIVDILASNEQ
jgi:L-lactate dehydrogenase complex protein LldE